MAIICAGWTLLILSPALPYLPGLPFLCGLWTAERSFEDFVQREGRKTRTHPEFAFLGIDQSTLEMPPALPEELANNRALQLMTERPFPWSREIWALLLDKLFAAGARLVLFDMIFNPPNDGDAAFHEALERYRNRVVIGANFDVQNAMQAVLPNAALIPPPQSRDERVGYVIFFPDADDGKVRAARYTITDRELAGLPPATTGAETYYSLGARALAKLGRLESVPQDTRPHLIRFSANDAYQPRPLYEVLDPKLWQANYANGAYFKDKVVMIGASSQVAHDFVVTPMDAEAFGPALHLQAIAAALDREFLHNTSARTDIIIVLLGGLSAWAIVAFLRRPLLAIALVLALAVGYLAAARIFYDRIGLLLFVVPPLANLITGSALSLGFEYWLERHEKLRTRRTLERYVSKNLVKEILENPSSFYTSLRGVRIPATILFSDIVGFTTLTESADPEALVSQLNEYLSRMTAAVFEHGGTLDKFIGDAVMAVWGNVSSRGKAEDAKACVRSALAMRRELKALNQAWHARGIAPFAIGIGINHGDVLGGNIGSQEKADPTVIGDAVNLASRLEALTRIYGADILIGESAAELVRDAFHLRSVALAQVKGKTRPVAIFTVLGERGGQEDAELVGWVATYEHALQQFRARDFSRASDLLSQFIEHYPNDYLATMYLERALEYLKCPPGDSWSAVEVFEKK